MQFDANYWKSLAAARLTGNLEPFGIGIAGNDPLEHRMLADNLASEHGQVIEGRRKCTEWTLIPGRDNHFLDCLVGALVAASVAGGKTPNSPKLREKRKLRPANV